MKKYQNSRDNIVRIFERRFPGSSLYNMASGEYQILHKYAIEFAEDFDDALFEGIHNWMVANKIDKLAVVNKETLKDVFLNYGNPDYLRVVRCEKCRHWKTFQDDLGACELSGAIRDKYYYCRDGEY